MVKQRLELMGKTRDLDMEGKNNEWMLPDILFSRLLKSSDPSEVFHGSTLKTNTVTCWMKMKTLTKEQVLITGSAPFSPPVHYTYN